MSVLLAWLRVDLRRRWRSLVVLALLIAISAATVLAAIAGARRGDTAPERLLAQTLPATAAVLPNQPGFDWEAVRALPEVEALATFPVSGFEIDGIPAALQAGSFPFDDVAMRDVERPVVLAGRLADPTRADEAVVSPRFVESYGKGVGDTVTLRLLDPRQITADSLLAADSPTPEGPAIPTRIVGVVRSFWFTDQIDSEGGLFPSAALFSQYRANLIGTGEAIFVNALVRLRSGAADVPAFRAGLAKVSGRTDIEFFDQVEAASKDQKVNAFEGASLLAFGLAALVAAMVLVGQAVARYTAATVADLQVLRAVGLTPRQAVTVATAGPALAALLGASLGVAAAVLASRWMPIGAPALLEPAPGIDIDWAVLGVGAVVAPLAVVGAAVVAGNQALAAGRGTASRRSSVATTAARAGLPVPVVVGSRFALEPGRGRGAVPVRPALLGAVTGVLGVLAAFTFSAGVGDAATNPARFGQTYELAAFVGFNGEDFGPAKPALTAIAADPDVAGTNDSRQSVGVPKGTSIALYTQDPVGAPVPSVLTEGRLPTAVDEVVLAPTSAEAIGAGVGSRIELVGNLATRQVTVTGIGFVPSGPHNDYDDGGWLTAAGYDSLFSGFKFHTLLIALRPGVDVAAVTPRLSATAGAAVGVPEFPLAPPDPLQAVAQIRDVQVLPVLLAVFLALLAVGAVGHALATAVRRRRHDVAVLRALGMTRWQSRGVVATQASLLAGIGLALGIPLGLALGRTLWRVVADSTPLFYVPPVAFWALVLIVPLALLTANLLAAPPGQRAARLRIGHVLRTE